jgi:hypothetical protein
MKARYHGADTWVDAMASIRLSRSRCFGTKTRRRALRMRSTTALVGAYQLAGVLLRYR